MSADPVWIVQERLRAGLDLRMSTYEMCEHIVAGLSAEGLLVDHGEVAVKRSLVEAIVQRWQNNSQNVAYGHMAELRAALAVTA